jgi:hypothetical protein
VLGYIREKQYFSPNNRKVGLTREEVSMLLVVKTSFPRSSLKEAAKAFTEMPRLPATVHRQGPIFHLDDDNGYIHSIAIYSFKNSAITHNERRFVEQRLKIFADVPDFIYTIEDYLEMEEALQVLSKERL